MCARAQNALAVLPMAAITLAGGEVGVLRAQFWSAPAVAVLALACAAGLGMSYFSFALRAVISATSFSVIGNVCKVLTILVNLLMWDNHASAPRPCPKPSPTPILFLNPGQPAHVWDNHASAPPAPAQRASLPYPVLSIRVSLLVWDNHASARPHAQLAPYPTLPYPALTMFNLLMWDNHATAPPACPRICPTFLLHQHCPHGILPRLCGSGRPLTLVFACRPTCTGRLCMPCAAHGAQARSASPLSHP